MVGTRVLLTHDRRTIAKDVEQLRQSPAELHLTFSSTLISRILCGAALFLILTHVAFLLNEHLVGQTFFADEALYVLFDLWGEVTIPTWYSSALFIACSGILGLIAMVKQQLHDPFRLHWIGLALVFLGLSIDDSADLHGMLSYRLSSVLDTGGFLAYTWIIPASALVAIVGLMYVRFLMQLPQLIRYRILLAGALFLAAGIGLEAVEARWDSMHGVENLTYQAMVTVEESTEMFAIILFLGTLLTYLRSLGSSITVRLTGD